MLGILEIFHYINILEELFGGWLEAENALNLLQESSLALMLKERQI